MRKGDGWTPFIATVFLALVLLILILAWFAPTSHGKEFTEVEPWQVECILSRIKWELAINPAYAWGGSGLEPGAVGDCSGKLRAIFAS